MRTCQAWRKSRQISASWSTDIQRPPQYRLPALYLARWSFGSQPNVSSQTLPFLHLLVGKRSHPFLAAEFVAQDLAGDGLIRILPDDLQQDLEGVVRIAGPQGLAAQNVEVGRVMIFDLAEREPQLPLFFGKGGARFPVACVWEV